jgi:hypothetical protein
MDVKAMDILYYALSRSEFNRITNAKMLEIYGMH